MSEKIEQLFGDNLYLKLFKSYLKENNDDEDDEDDDHINKVLYISCLLGFSKQTIKICFKSFILKTLKNPPNHASILFNSIKWTMFFKI